MTTPRVTGIGGIFFKARGDKAALLAWYQRHLGIDCEAWGGTVFRWDAPGAAANDGGSTVWSVFPGDAKKFGPPERQFMINYRVADLDSLLKALRAEGCNVDEKSESGEYGKFGWVTDPDGNRIELWEPPATPPQAG